MAGVERAGRAFGLVLLVTEPRRILGGTIAASSGTVMELRQAQDRVRMAPMVVGSAAGD